MTGKALHQQLLDGLDNVKSRPNGTVHTLHDAEGKVVAEICVGKRATRVNFRIVPKAAKGLDLTTKSKTWVGGGIVVTDENVSKVKAALASVLQTAEKKPAARKPAAAAA